MRNPKEVYTEHGLEQYIGALRHLEDSASFLSNQEDDLHLPDEFVEQLFLLSAYLRMNRTLLRNGDGTEEDDGQAVS